MTDVRTPGRATDQPEDTAAIRRPRRGRWIAAVLVLLVLLGVTAWQVAARTARIEPGGVSWVDGGLVVPDCVPTGNLWASFDEDEEVLAAQTIRNSSPFPVTVTSQDPATHRLEPRGDEPYEQGSITGTSGDVPEAAEGSVVVPPGQDVTLWIHDPQGETLGSSSVWYTFDGVSLTVRALGVERDVWVPFSAGVLQVGGPQDSADLGRALEAVCAG